MATVYNWVISSMIEYPTTPDNLTDVVFQVNWRRNATEVVDDKTYFADTFGALSVPPPAPEDFIPYADLTQDDVIGWLEAGLDVQAINAGLQEQINLLINPTQVSLPLPWVPQPPQPEPTPEPTPEPETEG
jgi:hypothetical protein